MADNVLTAQQKVEGLKKALHEKKFQAYTPEQVSAAVDVAIGVLPRVKNYFTQLDKAIKILTPKTGIVVKLAGYAIAHPEVNILQLTASLKAAAGTKVIPDTQLNAILDAGTFAIVSTTRAARASKELDFDLGAEDEPEVAIVEDEDDEIATDENGKPLVE